MDLKYNEDTNVKIRVISW